MLEKPKTKQKIIVKYTGNCSSADAISERNPRVIDDARARKLASDLKRCSYYETCATYGLNVERVFQDGKQTFLFFLFQIH